MNKQRETPTLNLQWKIKSDANGRYFYFALSFKYMFASNYTYFILVSSDSYWLDNITTVKNQNFHKKSFSPENQVSEKPEFLHQKLSQTP